MGILSDILTNGASQIVGGLGNIAYSAFTNSHLTGSQREANAFNADQAQLSRDFEAQQAQIARDWQEQQYLKYNSPSALVRQYNEAGINPALMFGGSTPQASVSTGIPSSASAGSVSPTVNTQLFDMFANLQNFVADIQNKKAQTASAIELSNKTRAEIKNIDVDTENKRIDTEFKPSLYNLQLKQGEVQYENTLAGIHKINTEIQNLDVARNLDEQRIINEALVPAMKSMELSLMELQKTKYKKENALLDLNIVYESWKNNFINQTGYEPNSSLYNAATTLIGTEASKLADFIHSLTWDKLNPFKKKVK